MCAETTPKLMIIAAACKNMGIGYEGRLPWKLRKEMAYFTNITSKTEDPEKTNAVIMGKRTWFSIPLKFRPLSDRINIVLSRELKELNGAHYLLNSLEEVMKLLAMDLKDKVESCFIIGGEKLYEEAMSSDFCSKIYLTKIEADFKCDAFFPKIDENVYKLSSDPNVPTDEQEEDGIKYIYNVYERSEKF